MRRSFLFAWVLVCLSGCATSSNHAPAETSSDSIVTVNQVYTGTEEQALDTGQANSVALKKCQARGYTNAEKLGPEQQTCTRYTGYYACFYHQVDQQYQCSGGLE